MYVGSLKTKEEHQQVHVKFKYFPILFISPLHNIKQSIKSRGYKNQAIKELSLKCKFPLTSAWILKFIFVFLLLR